MKEWLLLLQVPLIGVAPAFINGTWRVMKARHYWISLIGSLVFVGLAFLSLAGGPKTGDMPTVILVPFLAALAGASICWIYNVVFLTKTSVRLTKLLERVEAADDHDGLLIFLDKKGFGRPEESLRALLPLIEQYGPVRGHENINPEWIRTRLARAEAIAPQLDQLVEKARELPMPKRRWWLPSNL